MFPKQRIWNDHTARPPPSDSEWLPGLLMCLHIMGTYNANKCLPDCEIGGVDTVCPIAYAASANE